MFRSHNRPLEIGPTFFPVSEQALAQRLMRVIEAAAQRHQKDASPAVRAALPITIRYPPSAIRFFRARGWAAS